jgi:hypothetical protein
VQVITERFSIEMAELDEAERRLEEAEEEELWLLTLHQQARHMHVSRMEGGGYLKQLGDSRRLLKTAEPRHMPFQPRNLSPQLGVPQLLLVSQPLLRTSLQAPEFSKVSAALVCQVILVSPRSCACLTPFPCCVLQQHLEFDLPQSAVAHMDPILYKKLDWEVTHGHDLLHHEMFQAADCEQVRDWWPDCPAAPVWLEWCGDMRVFCT